MRHLVLATLLVTTISLTGDSVQAGDRFFVTAGYSVKSFDGTYDKDGANFDITAPAFSGIMVLTDG